jgi:hypothetical protein
MSNDVLNRIQSQIRKPNNQALPMETQVIQPAVVMSPDIPLEELREILMSEMNIQKVDVNKFTPSPELTICFENIYDFSNWYTAHQDKFTNEQRVALDTILKTRAMIEAGCACKRSGRESAAHEYFGQFWSRNKHTDLLPTILKITSAAKISISGICSYP